MAIGGYSRLNHHKLLMGIGDYFVNGLGGYYISGYWWLLYHKLLLVIPCYITTINDYSIISYCWIF